MIRILFGVSADADNVNAQSLNAREIALRLDPQRFASTFFVWRKPDPRLLSRDSIRFVRVPPRLGLLAIAAQMIWGSENVIFYPLLTKAMQWYLSLRVLGKRKQIITPVEGPIGYLQQENPAGYTFARHLLAASDVVIPISEFVAASLYSETGIETQQIIPVGVETHFFIPVERSAQESVRVLFVGRLIERKGVGLVVEAARRFPNTQFQLVGSAYASQDKHFAESLKKQVRDEGLGNVEFLGSLSRTNLRAVMNAADVLLHPSRIDGIPKVTLEAAATGLPCIVFDDYRTPSVVDGVTGFQVKTFDEMLAKLQWLIENRELRLQMGRAAVEHVKQFDWDIVAKKWERVFEEVVRDG